MTKQVDLNNSSPKDCTETQRQMANQKKNIPSTSNQQQQIPIPQNPMEDDDMDDMDVSEDEEGI